MSPSRQLFTRHGIRCTKQRLALYEALHETRSHPTAEELYHMVKPRTRRLSLATVYNTLEVLCKSGLCKRLQTDGSCRYDADMSDHLHLRFRGSDEIRDVPPQLGSRLLGRLPQDVLDEIEQRLNVKIDGLNVQLLVRKGDED